MSDRLAAPPLPASAEFVYVAVPVRDYAAVVQFLVERVLTRRRPDARADDGGWPGPAVDRLAAEVAGLPLGAVLEHLAAASPRFVPFGELAAATELGAGRLRAQVATLTKLAATYGLASPIRTRPARGAAPTAYQLPAELASAWSSGPGSTSR